MNYKFIVYICVILLFFSCIFVSSNVSAETEDGIKVPIIMYHSILKSKQGDFIVSPDQLEEDFKYIKENGYTAVTMADLIEYVYNDIELPDKPIVITFDDGYYNNYNYVVPLLIKYELKCVISIVGQYTDTFTTSNQVNTNYSYLRWVDINMLIPEGIVEFQNHTYNLHKIISNRKGCSKKSNESIEEYQALLKEDILKLQNEFKQNAFYTPNTFTYPYGLISKESIDIVKELEFKASLSTASGMNYITKDPDCLYLLKRYNRKGGYTTKEFFRKIEKL